MDKSPNSYSSLPYKHIRLSHVPNSSSSPTRVILLTLYRPGRHNAFTNVMTDELVDAFGLLSADDRVKVIVVTGHGTMFCAGADLDEGLGKGSQDTVRNHRDGGGRVSLSILRCTKPTIAAINGSAVGVGITMCLPMNIRIVSSKAKIGFVFARRGIVMEAISGYFLPRLIGYSRAIHLVTTGAVYPSPSPLFQDLFSEIVEPGAVLQRALDLADDIARNTSLVSTHLMKDMIWRGPENVEESHLLNSKILVELFRGKDKLEGVESFLLKREANFTGTMPKDAPSVWPWWKPIETAVVGARATKSKL